MASKDFRFGVGSKLDLKNHILESCSSSLKSNLTSVLSNSSFSNVCKQELSGRTNNIILQTSKMSLENLTITSSFSKRKHSSEDMVHSKRTALSSELAVSYRGDNLSPSAISFHQKEYVCEQKNLSSETDIEGENIIARDYSSELSAAHQMPLYVFSPLTYDDTQQNEFYTARDQLLDYISDKKKKEHKLKDEFLTLVSTSLTRSPNFQDLSNEFCQILLSKSEEIASQYPEFILKVALYTRQELNIRTTANFLLAYAAHNVNSRFYLKRYFTASICLPTDWIEVAEICKKLSKEKGASLPSALRKAMVEAFLKFNCYQLAKYNRDPMKQMKRKKKRRLKQKAKVNAGLTKVSVDDQGGMFTSRQTFTLKRLIQVLHITKPVEHVMCILGKKYPLDFESFQKSKLPGSWEKEKAGKRMKLPAPTTWETEVSAHGNKAAVWENLIDEKKLPYMAMLRNIRNLLIAGISKEHHKQVLLKLCNEKAVMKSRQFPLRFFTAYEVIHELERFSSAAKSSTSVQLRKSALMWKIKRHKCLEKRAKKLSPALLKEYRCSVDKAVEISCRNNVDPIQGKTLVICDILSCHDSECQRLKGSVASKMHQACVLLGMMIYFVAEECELKLVDSSCSWKTLNVEDDSILANVLRVSNDISLAEVGSYDIGSIAKVREFYIETLPELLKHYLCPAEEHVQINQIVLLTSGKHFDETCYNIMRDFAKKYRNQSNKHLLYLNVDLTAKSSAFNTTDHCDVTLCGFSDQLLRFMSERGDCRQLEHVESIDQKYGLKPIPKTRPACDDRRTMLQSSVISKEMQKWKTVRVFISSTFKDMHGERDIIVRFIMPELRARAKTLCINIHEVDLRWGITEEESSSNKAMEICLNEASRCEFFIGILSERYGNVCDFSVPDNPEFQWLMEYPPGASITELEIYCAALSNPTAARNNSFFYFRDESFAKKIPEIWKDDFLERSECNIEKLKVLKEKIKLSGLEVFENYPCTWGGVINGLPVAAGLEEFGERILQNLWNALCKEYKKVESPVVDQKISTLHSEYSEAFQPIIGQVDFVELCTTNISKNDGIFLITGKSGCGKTALMRELSKEFKLLPTFPYFFGIDSRSYSLPSMLKDLIFSLISYFKLESIPPTDYQNMINLLPNILEAAIDSSPTSAVSVFIDGLDHIALESDDILNWLPCTLPKGLKIVFSVSQESFIYRSLLEKLTNYKPYFEFAMKPLSLSERQEFVTNHLEPHHKVLDKSPFNNQLLMLSSKRDAGYPLYLHTACEELRTFGIFEKLTPRLQSYPQTFGLLLKEVISQLENFHGRNLLKIALCLLEISSEGLTENELHVLLSVALHIQSFDQLFENLVAQVRNLKPEDLLPPLKFSSLLRTLCGLLEISGSNFNDTLRITHHEIQKFVHESYMSKADGKMALTLHRLLAAYFYNEFVSQNFGVAHGVVSVRFFRLLPHHLIESEQYREVCDILCNISYIKSALETGLKSELLDQYLLLKELFVKNRKLKALSDNEWKKAEDYYNFVSHNLHILTSYPFLIHQQALNEPDYSSVYKDSYGCPKDGMIRWMTNSHARTSCYLTLSSFQQAVVTVAASSDGKVVALGAENGLIQIIDVSTGKLLRTFRGHSQVICNLCFYGNSQLCSASADCTLSVWDIDKGHRIHTLTGHTRRISSCCFSLCGRHIISVAWDCTLCVWNAKDGQQLRTRKIAKKPLTCLSHHPDKALVVTGGWDRKLQIWDLIEMTKKRVLKGHSASIRSVAFSPCGQTIVSASFSGEIFYWSLAQGIQIGKIANSGHSVNCLHFTKSGDMLISGGNESLLKIWSYKRGETVQEIRVLEYNIHCVTFLSLEFIAVGYKDGECVVFEISTGHEHWKSHYLKEAVTCVEPYYNESFECLLGCILGTIAGHVMWARFQEKNHISITVYQEVTATAIFKGNMIAGVANGDIFIIPLTTLKPRPVPAHQSAVTKCVVKQDQLITASKDHSVKIWHLVEDNDLVLRHCLLHCHGDWVTACSYSKNILITGSQDCSIKIWGNETLENRNILSELKSPINHLALEGNYIIAGTIDGCVGVWNNEGAFIASVPPLKNCGSEDVAHITRTVLSNSQREAYHHLTASVEENGHLVIRKPFSKTLMTTLTCQSRQVSSFCVTPGDEIVSCSFTDKVQFWKLDNEECNKQSYTQHKAAITRVEISPDGKYALSTDRGGRLIVWMINLTSENCLQLVTVKEWEHGCIASAIFAHSGGYIGIICAINKLNSSDVIESFAVSLKLSYGTITNLKEMHSCCFGGEVFSMSSNKKIVIFGLKSGTVVVTDKSLKIQKSVKVSTSNSWIFKTFSSDGSNDIYAIDQEGILKLESYKEISFPFEGFEEHLKVFENDIGWPKASYMTADTCYIGTSDGFLHVISEKINTKQKIHSDAVNDIRIYCNFIFTCSDDNTIKIWETTSLKQVGLFCFPLPITVLAVHHTVPAVKGSSLICIICGTETGKTHLLTWQTQTPHSSL